MGAGSLRAELDAPLPAQVATGAGTAVFVCGWCYSPRGRLRSLSLLVGGERQPLQAFGMPRLDEYARRREPAAYASGFWGIAKLAPPAADAGGEAELEVGLEALLPDGSRETAVLQRISVRRQLSAPPAGAPAAAATRAAAAAEIGIPVRTTTSLGGGRTITSTGPRSHPRVAICMATYNPPPELLDVQLASIREQAYQDWVCLISDDCSDEGPYSHLTEAIAGDPRFVLSRAPRRLGFYHNFERALTMVPPGVRYVALADQDDRWHPEKLATLLAQIGDAPLIYSDARVVARDGTVLSETYWSARRNNHDDLLSLLVANSVTGAASLIRRELLDDALPFPPGQFAHYHDHWLALVAACLGEIAFVPRPLYDYVQHEGASLGHATANLMPTLGQRLRGLASRGPRERIRKWRMHYFVDVARLQCFATVLEQRCGERMPPARRRLLHDFLAADGSWRELMLLGVRGVRELLGAPETLGAEWMLFGALVWRRLLTVSARSLPQRRLRLDALPPEDLAPRPAAAREPGGAPGAGEAFSGARVRALADKIAPLTLRVTREAPVRVNLLIPTIDLEHFFGGYIAKFNLALALARRGHRVRVVTVDPTGRLPRDWPARLGSYEGLAGLDERVEIAFGRETEGGLEVSDADSFIATTWWTAHIADAAVKAAGGERFLYLIQEFEPFTFEMGSYAALATASYAFPHAALFSTELLRDYFRGRRLGVFAEGFRAGDAISASFQNAITPIPRPSVAELEERAVRRLLFYARPEPHAARNLFELGVLALERALAGGALRDGWELHGIGAIAEDGRLELAGGGVLSVHRRAAQEEYRQILREHDLGLALMYTPHPSLVPLEMASAGMLTVTNTFANKTPETLRRISENLIAAEPTVEAVAAALADAAASIGDFEARVAGSSLSWPTNWDQALDDRVLSFVESVLRD